MGVEKNTMRGFKTKNKKRGRVRFEAPKEKEEDFVLSEPEADDLNTRLREAERKMTNELAQPANQVLNDEDNDNDDDDDDDEEMISSSEEV